MNQHNDLTAHILRCYTAPDLPVFTLRAAVRHLQRSGMASGDIQRYMLPAARAFIRDGRTQRPGYSVAGEIAIRAMEHAADHAEEVAHARRMEAKRAAKSLKGAE